MEIYSISKALREFSEGRLSGYEERVQRKFGKKAAGLNIPLDQTLFHRDLAVGTDSQGGYTVATDLRAGSFIELLQNKLIVREAGATVLDGLEGDVGIPTQATGATAAWEGENDENAESSPTFGQLSLSPHRVGSYVEISKQLLVQSSLSVDTIIANLLADSIAQAVDTAALHGTGTGDQPTGIINTTGIGSVVGGTNGLAPTLAHIIELETDVSDSNADMGSLRYITNSKVRGKLKQTFRNSTYGDIPLWADSKLNDYPALVSNNVSSTLDKGTSTGVCSAIFFGNWADLILGFWGGLNIVIDPYTMATTNKVRITANTYVDVGVRHAASFSVMADALTS